MFQPNILMTQHMPNSQMNQDQLKNFQRRHLYYSKCGIDILNVLKHSIFDTPSKLSAELTSPNNQQLQICKLPHVGMLKLSLGLQHPSILSFRITSVSCLFNRLKCKSTSLIKSQTSPCFLQSDCVNQQSGGNIQSVVT